MDVMLDLETLGTAPDAAIIQIGAVLFELKSGGKILNDRGFCVAINQPVGSIDGATLAWWLQQPSARRMGSSIADGQDLVSALSAFCRWASECGYPWPVIENIWAKPSNFDIPIIVSAFRLAGMQVPWDHWKPRCARTFFAMSGGEPQIDETGFTRHNALDDAIMQAMKMQKGLESHRA